MRDRALYFPYINVPRRIWTFRSLLYWDALTSIVPTEFRENPNQLTQFMRDLSSENLVVQVSPGAYLHRVNGFTENFINLVDTTLANGPAPYNEFALIHMEKLSDVGRELVDRRLAFQKDHSWYFVEKTIAGAFMAYLSGVLGQLDEVNSIPVTDQISNTRLFSAPTGYSRQTKNRSIQFRMKIFDELLPYPKVNFSLSDLVDFKARHGNLLPRFRNFIEAKAIELAQIDNDQERKDLIDLLMAQWRDETGELIEAMQSKWGDLLFGKILPVFGAGATYAATEGNLAATGAAATLISAISQTIKRPPSGPLVYVAHAEKRFGAR